MSLYIMNMILFLTTLHSYNCLINLNFPAWFQPVWSSHCSLVLSEVGMKSCRDESVQKKHERRLMASGHFVLVLNNIGAAVNLSVGGGHLFFYYPPHPVEGSLTKSVLVRLCRFNPSYSPLPPFSCRQDFLCQHSSFMLPWRR